MARPPSPSRPTPPSVELALERLRESGSARVRAMFGGFGFYLDGLFVAIEVEGRLYLKADALSAPWFERAGGEVFVFRPEGAPPPRATPTAMAYWSVPDDALEQPGGLVPWARLAMEAALRTRKPPADPAARAKGKVKVKVDDKGKSTAKAKAKGKAKARPVASPAVKR